MPTKTGDLRKTHRYQCVRAAVIEQEPWCWLRFTGCTGHSTTADHIVTVQRCMALGRPDLVTSRDNMHGACPHCNSARQGRSVEEIRHLMGAADVQPLRFFS